MKIDLRKFAGLSILSLVAILIASTITVSATDVTIDSNLSVSPSVISFETVFPGEVHFRPLNIDLSLGFIADPALDDVEYRILQRPKPKTETDREYCQANPTDYTRCYRSLCPYLSKTPDGTPANDTGVPAFHDPNAPSSIAQGRLAKSDSDTADSWVIDLHVPCFSGECSQASTVEKEYQLDPSLNREVFGCDLVVEVESISHTNGPLCDGKAATIYVNESGVVVGGPWNGQNYGGILQGTEGGDVIIGTDDSEQIHGLGGDDTICALGGTDDAILGGAGNDRIFGEDGADELIGEDGDDYLDGGAGYDTFQGGSGNDTILGGAGADLADGGDGADTINGDAGRDTLRGGAGSDTIHGGDDNDLIDGQADSDQLFGDAGNDTITGGTGNDALDGGPGTDILNGSSGTDSCTAGEAQLSCP